MTVFGPVSSIFDFLTFWVMLSVLHAGHVEFRTGWFVESIATQTLVVYVIRTRRVPFFKSRPSLPMLLVPTGAAVVGALLPYTALPTADLGFVSSSNQIGVSKMPSRSSQCKTSTAAPLTAARSPAISVTLLDVPISTASNKFLIIGNLLRLAQRLGYWQLLSSWALYPLQPITTQAISHQ
jgi:hypothetical protein